ncbi:MAG: hypothetical protein WD971_11990 [Pirellulales bacterium]
MRFSSLVRTTTNVSLGLAIDARLRALGRYPSVFKRTVVEGAGADWARATATIAKEPITVVTKNDCANRRVRFMTPF